MTDWWSDRIVEDTNMDGDPCDPPRWEVDLAWPKQCADSYWHRLDDETQAEIKAFLQKHDPQGYVSAFGWVIFYDLEAAMLFHMAHCRNAGLL